VEEVVLKKVCAAVASLHRTWARFCQRGPAPGVRRRIEALSNWQRHTVDPHPALGPGFASLLAELKTTLSEHAPAVLSGLRPWADKAVSLQPCVRDLRRDHVLISGREVAGVVDFGAADVDTPAVDLARLFGELVGEDDAAFASAVGWYREAIPAFEFDTGFVRLLDRATVLGSLVSWGARLAGGEIRAPSQNAKKRVAELINRARQFKSD
jgi:Ser/Thr protein kinase RdoA (MazF antagonist)